jgi:hypothetical protein
MVQFAVTGSHQTERPKSDDTSTYAHESPPGDS